MMVLLAASGLLAVSSAFVLPSAAGGDPGSARGRALAEEARVVRNYQEILEFYIGEYGLADIDDPGTQTEQQAPPSPFQFDLLAKAPKDECFVDIGITGPEVPPDCPEGAIEKANEAYAWGMFLVEGDPEEGTAGTDTIYFGTGANVACLVQGSFLGTLLGLDPDIDFDQVCEFGSSPWVQQNPFWPQSLGDFRPPRMLRLEVPADGEPVLTDFTPALDFGGQLLRNQTLGIRSVGVADDVVLYGGPNVGLAGVNLFAFATDGTYLGSTTLNDYHNIRKFVVHDGQLYVGVLNSIFNLFSGGTVLRWTPGVFNLFSFQVVGRLDNEVAELVVHTDTSSGVEETRLVAGTWPGLYAPLASRTTLYGLFESPPIPPGGLTGAATFNWSELWRIDELEPDDVTAHAIASGAIASYNGYLWFGTLMTPGVGVLAWINEYGFPSSNSELNQILAGTQRQTAFLRGHKVPAVGGGTVFETELLYGLRRWPVYDPQTETFNPMPNRTGAVLSGLAGFDSLWNLYTWSAVVGQDGLLYVGTFDISFTLYGEPEGLGYPPEFGYIGDRDWGADLWVFGTGVPKGRAVQTRGLMNDTNYGLRNMKAGQNGVYAGTANPSNLDPRGGWEMVKIVSPLHGQN